jgi:quercetin dioxygenase-like cupin family protein
MTNRRIFTLGAAGSLLGQSSGDKIAAKTIREQALPAPFTGWKARFVEVHLPAGVKSTAHQHAGFVLGYVVEGEFRFALNSDAATVLRAGETFYEPPGATHTVGESGSSTRAAKILAVIIAPESGK